MALKANYHTHTNLCDGKDSPEEMAREAFAKGFSHLGFSGHMDMDIHMDFPAYLERIKALKERYAGRMQILSGVELDSLYPREEVSGAEYIIGSTHFLDLPGDVPLSVDNSPQMLKDLCRDYFSGDYYALSKAYYDLESKVIQNTGCSLIGHFDLVTRFNDSLHFLDEEDPRYLDPAMSVMEALAKEGIPFELNTGAVCRGRKKDFYPGRRLLAHLCRLGGRIVISSDAHEKALLDGAFPEAVQAAREAGFTHTCLLTGAKGGALCWEEKALDSL